MPNKLTDSEIVKALEDTLHRIKGAEHLIVPKEGVENLCNGLQTALDLINRLQAEIEKQKAECEKCGEKTRNCIESLQNSIAEKQAENERLKKALRQTLTDIREAKVLVVNDIKTAKAEAYKECIEKVEEIICDNTYPDFDINHKAVNIWKPEAYKNIRNLLNELVGEDNAKEKE